MRGFLIIVFLALLVIPVMGVAQTSEPQVREPVWMIPDPVVDVAISGDKSVVAIAATDTLKVYDINGNLLWSWAAPSGFTFSAVAVSKDGNSVAASYYQTTPVESSYIVFWSNAKSLRGTPDPDWVSRNLLGKIGEEALAVTGDGKHVAAVGTGPNIFYWVNAISLTGSDVGYTWSDYKSPWYLEYVGVSNDGNILVAAGIIREPETSIINVYLYKNAATATPTLFKTWSFTTPSTYVPAALSDDGRYFVIALGSHISVIDTSTGEIIWNSTDLFGDISAVDISGDGSTVVVGVNAYGLSPYSIEIFHNIASKSGSAVTPDISVTAIQGFSDIDFTDIALDYRGDVAIAGTGDYVFAIDTNTGELLWYYGAATPSVSVVVDISDDGAYAVTGGGVFDSAYIFNVRGEVQLVGGELISSQTASFHYILAVIAVIVLMLAIVIVSKSKRFY